MDKIKHLDIFYGTSSLGHSKAKQAADMIYDTVRINFPLVDVSGVERADSIEPVDLKYKEAIVFVVSTDAEGNPPGTIADLFDELSSGPSIDLGNLKYAVLALGDSSYGGGAFCRPGRQMDELLKKHGAKQIIELGIADDSGAEGGSIGGWIGGVNEFIERLKTSNQFHQK